MDKNKEELQKLGDCRCIPRQDKEDLYRAVKVARFKASALPLSAERGSGILTTRKARDILNRIDNTPNCPDGDISKECTCLSDLEREAINTGIGGILRLSAGRLKPRFSNLKKKIESVKKSCP